MSRDTGTKTGRESYAVTARIAQTVDRDRWVRRWLWFVFAMIAAMVVIGGVTRLTGSGLSMVEWKPLFGALPPLSESAWRETFAKYQRFPQYAQVNSWMTLADFKEIFFWEYVHRLWGRLIGVVFFVPWVVLLVRRRIRGAMIWKTGLAFVLGGLQGVLGWFMVKSGLVNEPAVSHYRLAAHLILALVVACWVLWLLFELYAARHRKRATTVDAVTPQGSTNGARGSSSWASIMLVVICVQIVYGAFMAGTRAGYLFATFPLMNGSLFPSSSWAMMPLWKNIMANPVAIHAIHRTLAYLVVVAVCAFWWHARTRVDQRRISHVLLSLVVLQFLLGVLTVVWHVPIVIAAAHQAGGVALLAVSLFAVYRSRAGSLDRSLETV